MQQFCHSCCLRSHPPLHDCCTSSCTTSCPSSLGKHVTQCCHRCRDACLFSPMAITPTAATAAPAAVSPACAQLLCPQLLCPQPVPRAVSPAGMHAAALSLLPPRLPLLLCTPTEDSSRRPSRALCCCHWRCLAPCMSASTAAAAILSAVSAAGMRQFCHSCRWRCLSFCMSATPA
jgi:hypothetical protein